MGMMGVLWERVVAVMVEVAPPFASRRGGFLRHSRHSRGRGNPGT